MANFRNRFIREIAKYGRRRWLVEADNSGAQESRYRKNYELVNFDKTCNLPINGAYSAYQSTSYCFIISLLTQCLLCILVEISHFGEIRRNMWKLLVVMPHQNYLEFFFWFWQFSPIVLGSLRSYQQPKPKKNFFCYFYPALKFRSNQSFFSKNRP